MLVSSNVTLLSSSVLIYVHDRRRRKNLILEMSLLNLSDPNACTPFCSRLCLKAHTDLMHALASNKCCFSVREW